MTKETKENSAHVWQTHCLTIIRRPQNVEHLFDKLLASNKEEFQTQMKWIRIANEIEKSPKDSPIERVRSSTYVAPPKILIPLKKKNSH